MKKKIIIGTFSALILITAVLFIVAAIDSYNYDMDPANGVDIMEGIGAAMLIVLGGFIVLYELDLFYTAYYFFIKPKTTAKTILNILSNFSLVFMFFSGDFAKILYRHFGIFGEETLLIICIFFTYVILRTIYAIVSTYSWTQEN